MNAANENEQQAGQQDDQRAGQRSNRLAHETSPYLKQHAQNPVDWYPWGEEALEKARSEDKPVMLSIGYSACHWCHVMAHESFENDETAEIMNRHFVNVKVDREERPDLDEIYMNAVTAMTGSGGWPMTVFLTPGLKPFYGGTYFPPDDRYGRPGFPRILQAVAQFYRDRRSDAEEQGEKLKSRLVELAGFTSANETLETGLLDKAFAGIAASYDATNGGFGTQPKFPPSMTLSFLLREHLRSGRQSALDMAVHSLSKMGNGGIYDHLGGGFHRYSVDAKWLIPHFEKMLYDNALLMRTYTEAFQATGDPLFRKVVSETASYVIREMLQPGGGFYATQDADSEGEEGRFFVWTPDEIKAVLGDEEGRLFARYYGVEEGGNFEHGTSVLHVDVGLEPLAAHLQVAPEELRAIVSEGRRTLFDHREQRVHPGRDEKIMTDWNGLMTGSLARASRVFGEPAWLDAAVDSMSFILDALHEDGRLMHTFKDGRARFNGYLDDYAFTVSALLDLYEATFDPAWFARAEALMDTTIKRFWDPEDGGFFFTSDDHETLIVRSKNPYDNAIPSGNAVSVQNLLRLAAFTGRNEYRDRAGQTLSLFTDYLGAAPSGFGQLLCGLSWYLDKPVEIALVGAREDAATRAMLDLIDGTFLPNKVVALHDPSGDDPSEDVGRSGKLIPLLANRPQIDGATTAYVCEQFVCRQPVTTVDGLAELLELRGTAPT